MPKTFLSIDEDRLDEEWLRQPELYNDYAVRLADARLEFDEAKIALDLMESEVAAKIRLKPERAGLDPDKLSEKAIASAIPKDPEFRKAQRALLDARHSMDVAQAAVTALEHKKRALTMLVELHGQNYFSTPARPKTQMGREAHESLQEKAKAAVRRLGKRREDADNDED
jgi:hypothetical protein